MKKILQKSTARAAGWGKMYENSLRIHADLPLKAIGTLNSIATSAMLKAGADLGATGEKILLSRPAAMPI